MEGIVAQNRQQRLGFFFQTCCREFLRILLGVFGVNEFPTHQGKSLAHLQAGNCKPSTIDSRIPGTDSRYMVS